MPSDLTELFDLTYVKLFEGPPVACELQANELGVNLDLFHQVKAHYRKAKENSACRVLADICQDIQDNGYIGMMEDSAQRVSVSVSAVQRWRSRFAETGLLNRHSWNGRFSVDPKVAIRIDKTGKAIKPRPKKAGVFTF